MFSAGIISSCTMASGAAEAMRSAVREAACSFRPLMMARCSGEASADASVCAVGAGAAAADAYFVSFITNP